MALRSKFVARIVVSVAILPAAVLSASAEQRPNVLFIIADDLNLALGTYTRQRPRPNYATAKTPNLDKLAVEGTRFEQFYATGVTCCPSRTGFMTSRHPASFEKYMSAQARPSAGSCEDLTA